jgi:hypothetical protein
MGKWGLDYKMSRFEELSREILNDLLVDFMNRGLSLGELSHGYAGVSLVWLKEQYGQSAVDFDLALKEHVEGDFVDTGPKVPFENTPGSGFVVFGVRSMREHAYLTEKGYKAAQKGARTQKPRPPASHVYISGGTFHQSPIGIGERVVQAVAVTLSDMPVFRDLRKAVDGSDIEPGQRTELLAHIEAMEEAHKTGGFVERYQQFIGCAANHMTLIAPFLPALTAFLAGPH